MYFQDLQKFLDEAVEGVIYFSLGKNMRSDHIPEEKGVFLLKPSLSYHRKFCGNGSRPACLDSHHI
jgi:hypothetical protein